MAEHGEEDDTDEDVEGDWEELQDRRGPVSERTTLLGSGGGVGYGLVLDSQAGESAEGRRRRRRSLWIVFVTSFLLSVGFSVVLSTLWPFLESVGGSQSFFGWVVGAYSLGQFLASPLFGLMAARLRTRTLLILALLVGIVSNMAYSFSTVVPSSQDYFLLVTRLVVGISAGGVVNCRAYASEASTLDERGWAMAMVSASQGLGFVVGPVIGVAFSELDPGFSSGSVKLNYLTAPGYACALLYLANIVVLLMFFQEYKAPLPSVAAAPARATAAPTSINSAPSHAVEESAEERVARNRRLVDRVAIAALVYNYFVIFVMFSVFETILTPLSMDQFGWTKQEADRWVGLMWTVGGAVGVFLYYFAKDIAEKLQERRAVFWGMIANVACFALLIPFGPGKPKCTNHDWCATQDGLALPQMLTSSGLLDFSYPVALTSSIILFSKMLGPIPQGFAMGVLTAAGSAARMLGPVSMMYVYDAVGPDVAFPIFAGIIFSGALVVLLFYRRLIPHVAFRKQADDAAPVAEGSVHQDKSALVVSSAGHGHEDL